jgi:signal transduction histidine kinase
MFRKRDRAGKTPEPYRHTVMEGFIDDYRRVRLFIALASLVLLGVLFLLGGQEGDVLVFNALGLSVMAVHAGWSIITGVRTPRIAIFLDITVIGAASATSVVESTSAILLAFWCVLITFLTFGRSRYLFYAYAATVYVVTVSQAVPAPDIALTISVLFMIGVAVLILVTVNQRMLMLELQRSQLLGSVSHELRNQLTGVMGMIDLALDKNIVPSQEEVRDLIVLARREAADATGIIEDLLTASRMESNVLDVATEPVDLDREVAKVVDHYPTEGMTIRHTGPRSGVVALADQVRLRQVLRNLLSNAVRYGGKSIAISVHPDGAKVHIQVADDGPGVPVGEEETIFLPYRRAANTPRHKSSVGLGLWISRRLAKAMGGDLTYRHVAGETVFEFTLPVYAPPVITLPTPIAIAEGTRPGGDHIADGYSPEISIQRRD